MLSAFLRRRGVVAAVVFTLVAAAAPLRAQTGNAALSGRVLDPDTKVVVNAAVIVRNEATNDIRTTVTDNAGRF